MKSVGEQIGDRQEAQEKVDRAKMYKELKEREAFTEGLAKRDEEDVKKKREAERERIRASGEAA